MSKKLMCTCGKEHVNNKPLIITITTCPKKNHHPNGTTTQSKPATSLLFNGKQGDSPHINNGKYIGTKISDPPDHILVCKDEGITIPSKNADKPLIDNSAYCDMDKESKKSEKSPCKLKGLLSCKKSKESHDKSSTASESGPGTPSSVSTDTEELQKYEPGGKHEDDFLSRPANNTFFDPSHSLPDEERIESTTKIVDSISEKPLKIKWDKTPTDAASNFPSDIQLKLPNLLPRYHGPGCAMEVDILEKHDVNCRYRKLKNTERNPVDDRSGSYEVIGRLMFKTCHPNPPLDNRHIARVEKTNNNPHSAKVATIYSLFNIPYNFKNKELLGESEHQLQKYLRRKKILEDLAKSSKSFPNNSKGYVEELRRSVNPETETKAVQNYSHRNKITSYEVEVLYFYRSKCDKSVQFSRTSDNFLRRKKWLYYIFPCIMIKESHTELCSEYSETVY